MRNGKNSVELLSESLSADKEPTRFKKLDKEDKATLKALVIKLTAKYWHENRQIPFADSSSEILKSIIRNYDQECGILIKDDIELKNYLQTYTILTINRLLKEEISITPE